MTKLSQTMMSKSEILTYSRVGFLSYFALTLLVVYCSCHSDQKETNYPWDVRTYDSLCFLFDKQLGSQFYLDSALLISANSDKSMIIYFSSLACVNCRNIESKVLLTPEVVSEIERNYNIVVLFTDVRHIRVSNERINGISRFACSSQFCVQDSCTLGNLNSVIQLNLSHSGHQPQFCVLNEDDKFESTYSGELINREAFLQWLRSESP